MSAEQESNIEEQKLFAEWLSKNSRQIELTIPNITQLREVMSKHRTPEEHSFVLTLELELFLN